jgi:hypothetical protein
MVDLDFGVDLQKLAVHENRSADCSLVGLANRVNVRVRFPRSPVIFGNLEKVGRVDESEQAVI